MRSTAEGLDRTSGWQCQSRNSPESVATLPPFGPIEGQKWFDQISSQWESQKNRFALIYFGEIQFFPPCIWNIPFMSYRLWVRSSTSCSVLRDSGIWEAADEAEFNNVHKNKNPKNLPLKLCTDHSVHLLRMIPLFTALYRRTEKRVAFSRLLINIKLFTFSIFVGHFRPTGSGSSRPKSMRIRISNTY